MQNLARDEAGNVWELDAQGNPVRVVEPAAPATGRVFSLSPNPRDAAVDADRQADNARADRAEARAAANAERSARNEERRIAIAEQAAAPMTRQQQGQARLKLQGIDAIVNQVARVEQALEAAQARGYVGPVYGRVPFSGSLDAESAVLDKSIAQLAPLIRQLTRTPGEGAMSDYESRLAAMALPSRSDNPAAIAESLAGIKDLLNQSRQGYAELVGEDLDAGHPEQRADNEVVDPTTGAQTRPTPDETDPNPDRGGPTDRGPRQEVATGDGTTFDPRTSSQIDALINAGASKAVVDATLQRQGLTPISQGEWDAAQAWRASNPGQRYFGANVSRQQELSLLQKAAGSPVGAFLGHMGNMGSAGIVPAIMGPEAQGALDASAEANPNAAFLGGVAGGVGGALAMEGAVGRGLARAPAALRDYAPRIADTLYGGLTGFTTAREGEGGMGALIGGAAGLGGNIAGQGITRGLGRLTRGVSDPNVRALREAGVPTTVGQTVGNSGIVGSAVRGAEDRMSGFWGVGDVVRERQQEGVEAFANRMANDAVAPIGGTAPQGYGEPLVNDLLAQGSDAYTRATAGANVPLDTQFATDIVQTRALGNILPDDLSARFGRAINNRVGPIEADGRLTGDTFQQAVRGLKSYRAEATRPGFEQDYRDALSRGIDALRDQMNRGGGAGVVENLANADQAWKRIKVVESATNAARNGARSGEVGLPMPSHFNDAATRTAQKYGGDRFNGPLIDAAQRILPNNVPDSGTAGRLGFGGLLAGGAAAGAGAGAPFGVTGEGAGAGLGTMLLLAAGGSRPAQRALTSMLMDRPELVRQVGSGLVNRARYGGLLGAATGTTLATQ